MKIGIVACVCVVAMIAGVSAQMEMQDMLMMRALAGAGRGRGASRAGNAYRTVPGSTSGSSSSGTQQSSSVPSAYGRTRSSRGRSMSSIMPLMALSGQMGDAVQDMMQCNLMPGYLKMVCMMQNGVPPMLMMGGMGGMGGASGRSAGGLGGMAGLMAMSGMMG